MKLYTWWRSQAAYRVRIAIALKGLEVEPIPLDLMQGDQLRDDYVRLNPQGVVPALIDGDGPPLMQSLAIIEYLDERNPDPPLLPADLRDRAYARALSLILASDAHPLITPRVRKFLERELRVDSSTQTRWIMHWMREGLRAVEAHLERTPRVHNYCCGRAPTLADICLVAHITTCKILPQFDFAAFPNAMTIFDHCMTQDAFVKTAPRFQPGAPVGTTY